MRIKTFFTVVILTLVSIGFIGSVWATPDESQRLRGLGGRTFAVMVTDLVSGEAPFANCYTFNEDGSWDDPEFLPGNPVSGTWVQDSTGAKTGYTATAIAPIGGGLAVLLTQVGTVTPAKGGGTLQLDAHNTVDIVLVDDPSVVIFPLTVLTSVGHQDNECST
ncbi:MAG: hypothetical protein WBM64_10455 [Woeseiaceae bacterium]